MKKSELITMIQKARRKRRNIDDVDDNDNDNDNYNDNEEAGVVSEKGKEKDEKY